MHKGFILKICFWEIQNIFKLENKKKIAVLFLRMFYESPPDAMMSKTYFHHSSCALSHMVALLVSAVSAVMLMVC